MLGRAARQSISRNDETEASSIVARGSRTQTVLLTTMRGRNGGPSRDKTNYRSPHTRFAHVCVCVSNYLLLHFKVMIFSLSLSLKKNESKREK